MEKSSAVLNYLQEQTQMIDGDHSQIAKLRPGQGGAYPNVLRVIKDGLQSASEQYPAFTRKEADSPLSAMAQPLPVSFSSTRPAAGYYPAKPEPGHASEQLITPNDSFLSAYFKLSPESRARFNRRM